MLGEMIEKILYNLTNNWNRYFGCFIGFVVGITIVKYGFLNAIFIFIMAALGYFVSTKKYSEKLRNGLIKILEKLKKDKI